MVDAFGGVGPRLWRGKLARARTEHWITGLVTAVRRGEIDPDPRSALAVMARLRGTGNDLLDARTAAVEVINVIRPTVAIAWYIAFAALALHENPAACERLAAEPIAAPAGELTGYTDCFMQEVRRFYPFAPYLGANVRSAFTWRGHAFEPGRLVLLDVYGTNHDPQIWEAPDEFRPERFERWTGDAFSLIPQGGGDPAVGHRCPGEWITMHQVTLALHFLTRAVSYQLATDQDLGYDLRRMPTRPRSGVVICNIQVRPSLSAEPPHLPSRTAVLESEAVADNRSPSAASAASEATHDRSPGERLPTAPRAPQTWR
jgi:fatty-acid peroxygenase